MDGLTVIEGILFTGLAVTTAYLMVRYYLTWLWAIKRQKFLKDPLKWYLKEIERLTWKISGDLALIQYYRGQVVIFDNAKKRDELKDRGVGIAEPHEGVE